MMRKVFSFITVVAIVAMLIGGCGLPETNSAATGIIEVRVTDAPPDYGPIKAILVTVADGDTDGIAVHKAAEGDGEGEWITIPVNEDNNPFELLALGRDGIHSLLGDVMAAPGMYTQIRLTVDNVEIVFEGETEADEDDIRPEVKLPSGKLKFVRPFEVIAGETTTILFDFLADPSVHINGQGDVIFTPVVKLMVSGRGKSPTLEASLDSDSEAEAELSTETKYNGKNSAHLTTFGSEDPPGDEARIIIPLPEGTTLGDIDSISWRTYLVNGYIPHVDMVLDGDYVLVAEGAHQNDNDASVWQTSYMGADVGWIKTFEGASGVYTSWAAMTGMCSDVETVNSETAVWMIAANDANFGLDTLANFVTPGKTDSSITVNQDTAVLALEIEIDNWIYESEVFVDDIVIVIGGTTYEVSL
jgi:hypothetical protein